MSIHGDKVSSLKEFHTTKDKHNKVCEIAKQVVKCLQKVHSIGFVHWDIKPHNILYTYAESSDFEEKPEGIPNIFTLIDFGICSPYLNEDGDHIPREKIKKFRGSLEFWAGDILNQLSM